MSRDCSAKVIGNWFLIEYENPTYKIILENALTYDFRADDVLSCVLSYFTAEADKDSTSVANKVYKKYIEGANETALRDRITEMLDRITIEVLSMGKLYVAILETFKAVYCPDSTKYVMAKLC